MTTLTVDLRAFLESARRRVNVVLARWGDWARDEIGGDVGAAIAYSLDSPGKRFRPALVQAVFRELGGQGEVDEVAAATEVVHTYSLVHDDLPCMDDDDVRRGRPTTHRRFGVRAASEAGFRMVPLAARVLAHGAQQLRLGPGETRHIARELFDAAGARGMVGGQVLDLEAEGREISRSALRVLHRMKTAALIRACAVIGAHAARASERQVKAIRVYGEQVGIAFQIADDVLDVTATTQELGKTAGKDARQQKATFATLLGPKTAMREARTRVDRAIDQLGAGGVNSLLLNELAHLIVNRRA